MNKVSPTDVRGPITAKRALDLARPVLAGMGISDFRLTFISAGEYIDARGDSARWEIFLELVPSQELIIFTIEPRGDGWEETHPLLHVSVEKKPWGVRESQHALPLDFRDSSEAVAALAEQGADWISGDTGMTLSSKFTDRGEPVWHTESYGNIVQTPFCKTENADNK